jgi:hypothetical protein
MSDSNPSVTRPDAYAYSGDANHKSRPSASHCNGDAARDQAICAWRPDTSNSEKAQKWREDNKATWDKPLSLNKDGTYTVTSVDGLDSIAERELKMMGKAVNKQAIEAEVKNLVHLNDKEHHTLDCNPEFVGNGWHLKLSISGNQTGDSGPTAASPDQGTISQNPAGPPFVPGRDQYGYGGPDQTYGQLPQGYDNGIGQNGLSELFGQNGLLGQFAQNGLFGQFGQGQPNYYYGDNYFDPSQQGWYQPGGIVPIPFYGGNGWNRQHQYHNGGNGYQQLTQALRNSSAAQNYETNTTTASNGYGYTHPNTSSQYTSSTTGRTTHPYSGSTTGRTSAENTGSAYTYGQAPGTINTRPGTINTHPIAQNSGTMPGRIYHPAQAAPRPTYTVTETAPRAQTNVHVVEHQPATPPNHKTT